MQKLEKLFWVDRDKLKSISKSFGEELEEGLQADGKNIVCLESPLQMIAVDTYDSR